METTVGATALYYAREGYWRHLWEVCNEELRRGPDPLLTFWKAFATFHEGGTTEAIRELETVAQRRDVSFAAALALRHYHRKCRLVDQDAVDRINFKLADLRTAAPDSALITGAQFYTLRRKYEKASDLLTEVLQRSRENSTALGAKAWLELKAGNFPKAEQFFLQIVREDSGKYLDSALGLAKLYELSKKFQDVVELLNELIVKQPRFLPVYLERTKVLMMIGDWDELVDSAQRILSLAPRNIEALRVWVFYLLAREPNIEQAQQKLKELVSALLEKEPKNPLLYLEVVKPIVRICGRRDFVLKAALGLVQEAKRQNPTNDDILCEIGYELVLLGDYTAGMQTFNEALQINATNPEPLHRMIHCLILQGDLDEASQQLEFLKASEATEVKTVQTAFLQSLIAWRKDQDKKEALRLLDEALSLHVESSKQLSPGYEFYTRLNPDFFLEIAKEYLQHVGLTPLTPATKPPYYLIRGTKLLETLTKQIPGMIESHLLLAKCKFVANEPGFAQKYLSICLMMDPSCVDALLLSALISVAAGQFSAASNAIEQALARNFLIRDNPMFMLIKGQVELKNRQYREALKTFAAAFELPGVKSATPQAAKKKTSLFLTLGPADRASIFTFLATAYAENNQLPEATHIIQEAIGEFAGTTEEVKILIANSELALKKGELKQALSMLSGVERESPHFKEAKLAMAEIYLNQMSNRRLFAKCFADILEKEETVENNLLYGEALMRIQEPEEAIKVYERALIQRPDDLFLIREVGRALVLTHDYENAIRYYETAINKDPRKTELLSDLAKLYLRLRRFDQANRVLAQALETPISDVASVRIAVKNYVLLAKVALNASKGNDPLGLQPLQEVQTALQNAKTLQKSLLAKARDLTPEEVQKERELCAEICYDLGTYSETRENNLDVAAAAYAEAVTQQDNHRKALTALAKLHLKKGEVDLCKQRCNALLRLDPSNEEAVTMISELLLQNNEVDEALHHYEQLLANRPGNYAALAKLLNLLRRAGRLPDAEKFLTQAKKTASRNSDAGLAYCSGIFHRFSNRPSEALEEFNRARHDPAYAEDTITYMIDVYLNPDDESFFIRGKLKPENIEAAETLLREMTMKSQSLRTAMLGALINIAKQSPQSVESAIDTMTEILQTNRSYVPAIIAFALAKLVQKKFADARSQLKSLSKMQYSAEFADYFEKGWLLLAEFYIDNNKLDLAIELLGKCTKHNKSCSKAEELLGHIKEKQQNPAEASGFYEAAWKKLQTGSIGYRLAFNYLSASKYVQAIDICHQVLLKYPEYPQIKEVILRKAREALRV